MSLEIGAPLPSLTLPASGGRTISLKSDFKGKQLVIYFYPKDNTSGCTLEGQDFNKAYGAFVAAGAEVLGVSRESVKSHDNFCAKYGFNFTLLSDADEAACKAFDVIKEKSMYGRKYLGIERSTFLFDTKGKLKRVWRGVKISGHVDEVLAAVRA